MTTLDELLDDTAGEPPRPLDLDRVHQRSRTLRRVHLAVVCAIPMAVVVVVLAFLVTVDQTDEGAVATFDLPPIEGVVGEYMPDGTPIWIVHDRDGSVYVVDAVEPDLEGHPSPGVAWASHWCPPGRYFASPWGAHFELDGTKMGGPARQGLTQRGFELNEDGTRITVADVADDHMGTHVARGSSRRTCEGSELIAHPEFAETTTLWDD